MSENGSIKMKNNLSFDEFIIKQPVKAILIKKIYVKLVKILLK